MARRAIGRQQWRRSQAYRQSRAGLATIEMVMVFPVLVGVLMLLLQAGMHMSNQAEAIVEARHDAWSQRIDARVGAPFDFDDTAGGKLSATVEKRVQISPIFAAFPQPKATHVAMGGAWDFRQIDDMNTGHLHYDRYLELANLAAKRSPGVAVNEISDVLQTLSDLSNGIENAYNIGKSLLGDAFDFESIVERGAATALKEIEKVKEQVQKEIEGLQKQIDSKNQEIQAAKNQIAELNEKIKRAQDPKTPEDEELDEDELTEQKEKLEEGLPDLEAKRDELDKTKNAANDNLGKL